jgi:hypothetical protein
MRKESQRIIPFAIRQTSYSGVRLVAQILQSRNFRLINDGAEAVFFGAQSVVLSKSSAEGRNYPKSIRRAQFFSLV